MASIHKQFRRDKEQSWITVAPDVEVLCSMLDTRSAAWTKAYNKHAQPIKKLIEFGMLSDEQDKKLVVSTFVEVCAKDWRTKLHDKDSAWLYRSDIEITDGEWTKFSREAAIDLFITYPTIYAAVVNGASELANFQLSEEELKNSKTV